MSRQEDRAREELLFWSEIMGDHARFIIDAIKPGNPNTVRMAEKFINQFDRIFQRVRSEAPTDPDLLNEASTTTMQFREFKRELLEQSLRKMPVTALTPTFYNHMLNELEQFLNLLNQLQAEGTVQRNNLGVHLLWVLDAAGHAAIVMSNLDKVEYLYREEAKAFENSFDKLYLKAVEIAGYYRSDPTAVQPVLQGFNRQIINIMQEFIAYLTELREGTRTLEIVGSLVPLVPDHMLRETHYYLKQIGGVTPA
ncbi:MAG TPA: DUF2935 domain-containing protein [Bacillota bacterium]